MPVHKVTKQKHCDKQKDNGAISQSTKVKNQGNCTRCGYRHKPRKCPAHGQVCKACHRKNHCAKMCNSRRHTDNRKVQQINKAEADDEEFFIGSIQAEKHDHPVSQINTVDGKKGKWQENLVVNRTVLKVRLDTGADCHVISLSDLKRAEIGQKGEQITLQACCLCGSQNPS